MLDPGKPEDACGRGSRTSPRERLGHYAAEGMSGQSSDLSSVVFPQAYPQILADRGESAVCSLPWKSPRC